MIISNKTFFSERSLYNIKDTKILNCSFSGSEDAESPLKECENIEVKDSKFDLRYPFWHGSNLKIDNILLSDLSRAGFWYCKHLDITDSTFNGVKAFRECLDIKMKKTKINSQEVFWKSDSIDIIDCSISGEYAFFESNNISLKNITFSGKYSFQYVNNLHISNSTITTKDAFWHANNVVVEDSIIIGEYLGWYSRNITFINCEIHSHQPLCYVQGLKLVDCKFIDCDLCFEYSEVNGNILGKIDSIKNPIKGEIILDEETNLILKDSKYNTFAKVMVK